ncbi:hypothetical protein CY35_08G095500 [Sphagnum magellanicum]|nr:hypothetical protein CY35_08G095500 [Sphagnum magellanicum]
MKNAVRIAALALLIMSVLSCFAIGSVDGSEVFNATSQCPYNITVCFYEPSTDVLIFAVALPGTSVPVTELYSSVPSLVIWGLPGNSGSAQGCFSAQPQADQAEFTINVSSSNTDSYQISNVNGYNLGITIKPQNSCASPSCSIPNITNFCQAPNTLTGLPGDGCRNTDGPNATSPTSGTMAFANACPDALSYPTDTTGKIFACPTGTSYEILFSCP